MAGQGLLVQGELSLQSPRPYCEPHCGLGSKDSASGEHLTSSPFSRGEHEGSLRMKTELLVQMDGLARSEDLVFVLAASNLPW